MDQEPSLFEMEVDLQSRDEITDTARWTKLYGWIYFSLGLIMLIGLLVSWSTISGLLEALSESDAGAGMAVILVVVILGIAVCAGLGFFLYRGSRRIRKALWNNDQLLFNQGLTDIRSFFIFYAIIMIIFFLLSIFSFIN